MDDAQGPQDPRPVRRGHRRRAKRRPAWLPLALGAVVAGGGVTTYVALDDSDAGGRSVADGADRVRAADAASPTASSAPEPNASQPTDRAHKSGPSPSKSARPTADAGRKDAGADAGEGRGSRSAQPTQAGRGAADRGGNAADQGGSKPSGGTDGAGDGSGQDRPGTSRPGAGAGSGNGSKDGGGVQGGSDGPRESTRARSTGQGGPTADVLALVNKERAGAGCRPLSASGTLNRVADTYAGVMADAQELSHTGPDGSTVGDRVTRSGYTWSAVGENIARGQSDAAAVMSAWMNSPGHRANILNCSFHEIGLGVEQGSGGPWWTQVFATGR
ncbi:CAP domain-containing protein [Streptomyces sp. HSW2009]|uniref:CAP domain-containing protein n=1 Tax=Streptomyces sp. HSW2009 TaxID=3142890 RepID=UPI0032EBF850